MIELFNLDNLCVLQRLPENFIDLIYCDILYNSGTSLVVAQELEIKHIIGCDISKRAIEISRNRLDESHSLATSRGVE